DWAVKQANFEATRSELIVAGHCGLPFAERRTTLTQNEPTLQWLNPGVIGMPANDGTRRVWYALLQEADDEIQLQIRSLDYDADTAARHMQDKPLPPTYAQTLLTGLWDNCEILPEVETARQGRPLSFV
ncbi:MAG: metallophosphoesterase, partial [Bacteroidota bacterium]